VLQFQSPNVGESKASVPVPVLGMLFGTLLQFVVLWGSGQNVNEWFPVI